MQFDIGPNLHNALVFATAVWGILCAWGMLIRSRPQADK